ncbi:conserved hypothetical protein [Microbacterium sp. C448]|uniref:metallophosphoesterase family protein n=1 Tax=Microbacterium TaxID=33882 RepID=UPI0003DE26B9|nr:MULTISPECIES: metallophosphoesterase [Microbacterium]CDK01635.1 conserved hypothetical protein [Microbacterium sp. C448]
MPENDGGPEGLTVPGDSEPLISILVVSDLHASSSAPGDKAGSWITTTTTRDERNHPIVGLRHVLEREKLFPTLLLCAGDITDKADSAALVDAWRDVNDLAGSRGSTLIATAGNHDVDSRGGTEIDPRGVLFDLAPLFPHDADASRADYWSRNYCIIDAAAPADDGPIPWRVVAVNSSAFHGLSSKQGEELDHGRVSKRTTNRLESDLQGRAPAQIQILLLHHHVEQLPDVDTDEHGQVREAEHLLAMLERTGPWLVVHGHKHRPYFQYARGGAGSAAVFSAASMAAFAWGQTSSIASNQVHLITLWDPSDQGVPTLGLAAQFRSWSWRPSIGWAEAEGAAGWPGRGGFGWRIDPAALARMIKAAGLGPGLALTAADLKMRHPELPFLAPSDIENLARQLDNLGIAVARDSSGEIVELRAKIPDVSGVIA